VYPVCDAGCDTPSFEANRDGYLLTARDMRWFWRCYLGPDGDPTDPLASPLHAVDRAGLPPTLVITAEYDPLRDEGEAYAGRLASAGVPVEQRRFEGMLHGFLGMDALVPEADEAMELVGKFLRRHLSG
jgi:acetyl esterase